MLAPLPRLPEHHEPAIPPYPGECEGLAEQRLMVRRTPVANSAATRAVYVHGLAGSSYNWTDLMYVLAPTMPGIALDLPGFGFSDPAPHRDYSIARHAQAVIDVIECEEAGPVHLFGNSMGGAVVIRAAAKRPDLVRTLTLISPALPNQRILPTHLRIAVQSLPVARLLGIDHARMAPEDRAQLVFDLCFADMSRLHPDRYQGAIDEVRRRGGLDHTIEAYLGSSRGLLQTYAPFTPIHTWALAKRVTAPTLAIFGAKDKLVDHRVACRVAEKFTNSVTVILGDVGHVAQMEVPERVATLVLQRQAELGER